MIHVERAGPLTTVQDLGRPGWAHLGVPRSGALDAPALRHANRLVGNPDDAAALETTLLGCAVRLDRATTVAVTGALATVKVDGAPAAFGAAIAAGAGAIVQVGRATAGVRSYLAFAGGIAVEPVLGSRSTDTLSGLGPAKLAAGDRLPLGPAAARVTGPGPAVRLVGADQPAEGGPARGGQSEDGQPDAVAGGRIGGEVVLGLRLGPRADWFTAAAVGELFAAAYTISPVSDRVGTRLAGPALTRARAGELPSEGLVLGAVQAPADGQPLIFLADHPTTGGYPVIGVVDDVAPLAQARPGATVYFRDLDRPVR